MRPRRRRRGCLIETVIAAPPPPGHGPNKCTRALDPLPALTLTGRGPHGSRACPPLHLNLGRDFSVAAVCVPVECPSPRAARAALCDDEVVVQIVPWCLPRLLSTPRRRSKGLGSRPAESSATDEPQFGVLVLPPPSYEWRLPAIINLGREGAEEGKEDREPQRG